jgi:hypothetical protein
MTKPLRGVIRNGTAWRVFWTRIEQDSTLPPPVVDFTRDMLLVAADGRRPAGYRIEIPGCALRGDTLFVLVQAHQESGLASATAVAPVAVVRVPRRDGPVVFRNNAGASYPRE